MIDITEDDLDKWNQQDSEPLSDNSENGQLDQFRVIRSNHDYTLDYWNISIGKNITLGPDYQRRSRWTQRQRSLLIESLMLNIPIPPIFLYENDYHEYEVVDGRQRLEAIKEYLDGSFSLRGLQFLDQYNGKKFPALELDVQRQLLRRTISATILLTETKAVIDDVDIRMILFDRLNTGGVKLNPQELRNAVMAGSFNTLLTELSEYAVFRKMWGIPDPNGTTIERDHKLIDNQLRKNPLFKTMTDCELVLRFYAIREVYSHSLSGSMRRLLDETMKKYKDADISTISTLRNKFKMALDKMNDLFGSEAFLNNQLTNPRKARNLYDSLMVAHTLVDENKIKPSSEVEINLNKLLADEVQYDLIISKGNSIENIKHRVNQAIKVLTDTI